MGRSVAPASVPESVSRKAPEVSMVKTGTRLAVILA